MSRYAKNIKRTVQSNFKCLECGAIIPLTRLRTRAKKDGHIKNIWCYKCKKTTKHKEIREFGDY